MNKSEVVKVLELFLSEGDEPGNDACIRAHAIIDFLETTYMSKRAAEEFFADEEGS